MVIKMRVIKAIVKFSMGNLILSEPFNEKDMNYTKKFY